MNRFVRLALGASLLVGAAGCGRDSDAAPPASEAPASPSRIISLSPTATEVLFAIDAGDQVIAIDDQSNYPPEALEKQHDLASYEPSVEAIAALDPDLVVIAYDTKDLSGQLRKLGIDVWVGTPPATFDDVYQQITDLGAATGHAAEAASLVTEMQADIAAAVEGIQAPETAPSYYLELDPTLYSATSNTFAGEVFGLFGLDNIADEAEAGNDYPQLSAEYIVAADPQLIFLADGLCCDQTPEAVAARAGWETILAVKSGDVIAIDDDIASRWGPRLVDYVRLVAGAVSGLSTPTG